MRLILFIILTLAPLPGFAQSAQTLIFRDVLGGVRYQDWFVRDEKRFAQGIRTVMVIGIGFNGDFEGELYIDCPNPAASKWLSVNGERKLTDIDVPAETIRNIRLRLCED